MFVDSVLNFFCRFVHLRGKRAIGVQFLLFKIDMMIVFTFALPANISKDSPLNLFCSPLLLTLQVNLDFALAIHSKYFP